jgi:predicted Rossmann fold nucleotide-binding protein DprA/Smf involved in DNA uptake
MRHELMEALTQTPQHLNQISQRAGLPATDAGVELIFLELEGMVRRLPGNTYIRTLG